MDVKGFLELELPIPFHDICTIYPVTVEDFVKNSNNPYFNKLFMPYYLNKELLDIDVDMDIYELILSNAEYSNLLVDSIKLLTHENDVTTIRDMVVQFEKDQKSYAKELKEIFEGYDDKNLRENCVVINRNKLMTKDLFDEFVDIVRVAQEIHPPEKEPEPEFQSEEGRRRWLALRKSRDEFKEKDKSMSIENIINVVQFGKGCYISSEQIRNWSMWKLINAHNSILSKDGYDKTYSAITSGCTCGDKDALKKHWSELLKVT